MMKIYTHLQMGEAHTLHCEDYLIIEYFGEGKLLCAVMDGCTMGKDSHFVSTMIGKILRKIAKELNYQEFINKAPSFDSLSQYSYQILKSLFEELQQSKNLFLLEKEELLSTLVLLLVDVEQTIGESITIGDGVICANSEITSYDQENIPDYIGYHLGEPFDSWYSKQQQVLSFDNLADISISTDGIFTFQKTKNTKSDETTNPMDFLLKDRSGLGNDVMLRQKTSHLINEQGYTLVDDLAIIRLLINDVY
ncbi:MAG: protein phosphatase 2C domain-containing protein [Bacteroidota bacterium]